jgi:hypothetical protein
MAAWYRARKLFLLLALALAGCGLGTPCLDEQKDAAYRYDEWMESIKTATGGIQGNGLGADEANLGSHAVRDAKQKQVDSQQALERCCIEAGYGKSGVWYHSVDGPPPCGRKRN